MGGTLCSYETSWRSSRRRTILRYYEPIPLLCFTFGEKACRSCSGANLNHTRLSHLTWTPWVSHHVIFTFSVFVSLLGKFFLVADPITGMQALQGGDIESSIARNLIKQCIFVLFMKADKEFSNAPTVTWEKGCFTETEPSYVYNLIFLFFALRIHGVLSSSYEYKCLSRKISSRHYCHLLYFLWCICTQPSVAAFWNPLRVSSIEPTHKRIGMKRCRVC